MSFLQSSQSRANLVTRLKLSLVTEHEKQHLFKYLIKYQNIFYIPENNRHEFFHNFIRYFQSIRHGDINGTKQNSIWNFLYRFLAVQRGEISLPIKNDRGKGDLGPVLL